MRGQLISFIIQHNNMGKRAKKFKSQNQGSKKVKGEWHNSNIPAENPLFKAYYQLQLELPPSEFELFWQSMKEKLPVVFRINPSCPNYSAFRRKVQDPNFLESIIETNPQWEEGEKQKQWLQPKEIPKLQVLQWYPNNVLHQINTTKQIFKKSKILNALHQLLQKAFDAGLVARQELVSMLPPLFLDINSSDIVLDMCAAPGSKTSQLLQMIYGQEKHLAPGCVIANDADYSRAQMLIHQINRSGTAGMAVINHPGQFLPELYTDKINYIKQKFQFDKVLCDVPCSGDGATRKLPIKWAKWHTSDGVSLHPLQLSILMKSINLLKRGGLIVYSTCSLNPIQNEAVLVGLFSKVSRGLQLIDIHGMYDIKGRRGMLTWKVCGIENFQQIKEGQQRPEKIKKIVSYNSYAQAKPNLRLKPSMFPPTLQEAQKMQLHHSMRMLPHDQNSGGFFIALMKKHQDFEWKYSCKPKKEGEAVDFQENFVDQNLPQVENPVFNENEDRKDQQNHSEDEESNQQQVKPEKPQEQQGGQGQIIVEERQEKVIERDVGQIRLQEPKKGNKRLHLSKVEENNKSKNSKDSLKYQHFENIDQKEFQQIQKFYALDPTLKKLLYVRDLEGMTRKKVLLVSEGVRAFLEADTCSKIKLVNMGCKVFEKGKESFAGYECLYRLSQEGIHFLLPFMKARKIKVSLQFFKSVIKINSLVHENIEDEGIRGQMRQMTQGSFCLYIDEIIDGHHVVDALVGQNFKNSFHLLVGKEQLASLNLRYL